AEDGIRDFHVTGVQTCALPILACRPTRRPTATPGRPTGGTSARPSTASRSPSPSDERGNRADRAPQLAAARGRRDALDRIAQRQIGRASCRERVRDAVVGGTVK